MWYVCYSEPKKVLPLVEALVARGRGVECPSFRFRRRVPRRNRTHEIERPLIGGVFFCSVRDWPLGQGVVAGVELGEVRRMLWQGRPATVSDEELDRLRLASSRRTEGRTRFKVGDEVLIDLGPFKGAQGIVAAREQGQLLLHIEGMSLPLKASSILLRKI